jgi:glycosyltransferase involved in cell wall biosynthesis
MRVLQVHNKYRPGWGGEDTVADLEADLLRRNGHEVERLSAWTGELEGASALRLVAAGFGTVWSLRGYSDARKSIEAYKPDVIHVHNTFPLLSPSIFWAANKSGVPVVQTLHNYRLTCANALLLRDDTPCEDCVGHFPWPALRYRCYGPSFLRTSAVVAKNVVHRWLGTFRTKIHAYIALTDFSKEIFVRAGLPSERIFVKPNFSADPGNLTSLRSPRFVFAGAIVRAKGIHLLLDAWARLTPTVHQLMIVGNGSDRTEFEKRHSGISNIIWCGSLPREKVIGLLAASNWLILPSLAYENFAMSVLEAFSVGTPVIVPNHGAFASIVTEGREGLLFSAGETAALTATLEKALSADPATWSQWSAGARNKFLREYTAQTNYEQLIAIYRRAIERFQAERSRVNKGRQSESVATVANVEQRNS